MKFKVGDTVILSFIPLPVGVPVEHKGSRTAAKATGTVVEVLELDGGKKYITADYPTLGKRITVEQGWGCLEKATDYDSN